jgi:hypothetical protein
VPDVAGPSEPAPNKLNIVIVVFSGQNAPPRSILPICRSIWALNCLFGPFSQGSNFFFPGPKTPHPRSGIRVPPPPCANATVVLLSLDNLVRFPPLPCHIHIPLRNSVWPFDPPLTKTTRVRLQPRARIQGPPSGQLPRPRCMRYSHLLQIDCRASTSL